jgi:hypothetical protein
MSVLKEMGVVSPKHFPEHSYMELAMLFPSISIIIIVHQAMQWWGLGLQHHLAIRNGGRGW